MRALGVNFKGLTWYFLIPYNTYKIMDLKSFANILGDTFF